MWEMRILGPGGGSAMPRTHQPYSLVRQVYVGVLTFTQRLDKLNNPALDAIPLPQLHLGRIPPVVLLDEAGRIEHDKCVVCDGEEFVGW